MAPGCFPSWGARRCRRSRLVKPAGRSARAQQADRSAWTRGPGKRMPGTRVQVALMTGLVSIWKGGGPGGGVVADAFGAGEAPAGRVAGLRHGGEVRQLFADAEVARLVDGGLGAERPSFFEVLPVLGFLAGQVEVRAGAGRDDLGAEGPGGAALAALPDGPAEDDVHLVRAADAGGCRGSAARRRSARSPAGPGAMVVENSICPSDSCQR